MPGAIANTAGTGIGWSSAGIGPTGVGVLVRAPTNTAAQSVLKRFVALRELPREDEEADIRWGKPGQFTILGQAIVVPTQPEVEVIWPDDDSVDDEDADEEPPPIVYDEVSREEEEIRIENPDDSEQYVIVARVTTMLLRRQDDQQLVQFNFNPPR